MITYAKLGDRHRGRLGNHLFQIASTIGLALKYGHDFVFPAWAYNQYFENPLPTGGRFEGWEVPEQAFTFQEEPQLADRSENYSIDGWRQSERYWEGQEWYVRNQFIFKAELIMRLRARWKNALNRPAIAISVRRGDFVDNPNYAQIPPRYYLLGLLQGIPDWQNYNVILFSDDLDYCKVHFSGLPAVWFAQGTDIEQLALMTMCRHFVISNSTFSWWGAWLGEQEGSIVIRPPKNFAGRLAAANDEVDYWPARWRVMDYNVQKIPLRDVTFTIPVFIDHTHRSQNLELSVRHLLETFDTNVIVAEQGRQHKAAGMKKTTRYLHWPELEFFHRTKMLNDMAKLATTPIVVNWDCDVFIPAVQVWMAAEAIRHQGADMVYPYDGRFARVPRTWYNDLARTNDIGIFGATQFTGKHGARIPTTSVGGAIMFNRESFLAGGGENEYMISFGPEDWERNYRFKALGYDVRRIKGPLFHLDHWCGPNSSTRNPHFKINHKELDEMRAMTADQLEEYVMTWPWRS
jgi:hypothetical protein